VWSVDRSARRVVESGARWPEEFNIDRVLCIVFFLPVPGVSGSCNVCDRWHEANTLHSSQRLHSRKYKCPCFFPCPPNLRHHVA
jgi:hypothetical protein